jgi:hypothetical protein
MYPGRNMNAPLKPRASRSFSVLPLMRRHMALPSPVESVPAPDTKQKVILGFSGLSALAAAIVRS